MINPEFYFKMNDNLFYQNEELSDSPLSLLSLMLFFIEDYYENDVYRKNHEILEINGMGEIDWNRTINYTFPIIHTGFGKQTRKLWISYLKWMAVYFLIRQNS